MMQEQDWVALVAVCNDAWLFSVSHYLEANFGFVQFDRKQLLDMINELPTVFETVFDKRRQREKEKASSSNSGSDKSKASSEGDHLALKMELLANESGCLMFVYFHQAN